MNVETDFFPICGRIPSHGISMNLECLAAVHEHRTTTENGFTSVTFYICKMRTREACGVLGRDVRVNLLDCMERLMKFSFLNEDGADQNGFAEADECE